MDAIDALAKFKNILNYVDVEQTIQSNRRYAVDQYVDFGGEKEPIFLTLQDQPRIKIFPSIKVMGYSIFYSGHPDSGSNMYPPETAEGKITLLPDKECVSRDKVVSRYGQPNSVGHYENGESSYSWNIVHDSHRLVVLSLARVSDTPTNDEVRPPWNIYGDPSGYHLASPRKSECEQIGVELRELRPHYHFRDVPTAKNFTLIDRVTLHPPAAKSLTRVSLRLNYEGTYPEHGAMLLTSGFMMYGSEWTVADLDRREVHCVWQTNNRNVGERFKDDIAASFSPTQTSEVSALLSDAKAGRDSPKRKMHLIADEPVNSVILFDDGQILQADDDAAFFAFPRLAEILSNLRRTNCTGKAVRMPIADQPTPNR